MVLTLKPEIEKRLNEWSIREKQSPNDFVNEALEKALEDWEDYIDAVRICALIDSGQMKTCSMEEFHRELDELDALEN
ncbi:MAG: hypothetical protein IJP69_06095 [Synergistaceae bacterium]|nr:hypothetical protein [Synergistaceae bacterium]MBR0233470.1 hypothetical protein [Synergistaceae bacterium]